MSEPQSDASDEPFNPEDYHLQDAQSANRHTLDLANAAAHKRRAGVYRDDWEKKPALLSTSTKILLGVVIVGGLGYGALEAYEYFTRNPDAMDKLIEKGPLSLAKEETASTAPAEVQPPLTLRGVQVKDHEGIIGDTVVGGPYAVEIYDAGTVKKTETGVAVVALMGAVGNASKDPLSTPTVQVFLLEQDGSRHAASDQRGAYKSGVALNPKLCLNHAWGFIVPDKTRFTHAVFEFPDKTKVQINLEERTPENMRKIEESDRAAFQAYMAALTEKDQKAVSVKAHVAGVIERETAQQRAQADKLQADVDASKMRTAQLLVEADECDKQLTKHEKKLKSAIDGLKRSKADMEKQQQLVIGAKARVAELRATVVTGADSRARSRQSDILDSQIVKAEQNLARLQQHAAEAEAEWNKDKKEQTELETAIKEDEKRLQALKTKLDVEQNQEMQLQKGLDDANQRVIDKEKAAIPGVSL